MDTDMIPQISAIVMIYNEDWQIRDCLETIKWVDEIIICDSFSTDRTIEICREYTDKVYQRKFDDFGSQKSWALSVPSHDWVLCVEADERFTPQLRDEITEKLAKNREYDGYWMPYKNYCLAREIKGNFWNTEKIKLFNKNKARWNSRKVHTDLIFEGKAGHLENPVLHYPYQNFRHWFRKYSCYTTLEAEEMLESGVSFKWYDIIKIPVRIPWSFYNIYVREKDYKNGLSGLLYSIPAVFAVTVVCIKYFLEKIKRERIGKPK